uniref:Solute carrier family 22 member 13a n=1 Tax=Cyprinodon variegatus TaxID=28743 RepID=A0A3Q2D361_CYPVA
MVDFGEILITIGDFGHFQKLLLLGLASPHFLLPVFFCSFLFIQSDPERYCNTKWILKVDPNLTAEEQLNLTVPREQDGSFSRCRMFTPVDWDINAIREHGLNRTTGCMNGYVYSNMLYESTIVTDFDLVCEKSNMPEITQTIAMTGLLAGSIIFGPLADMYGRKKTTQLPVVLLVIFVIVAGVSPNIHVYNVSQFIVGAALGAYRMNSIVLATEWIGINKRSLASCLSQVFGSFGQCAVAGLVYVIRNWRKAQYVMAVYSLFLFSFRWIPESARWLLGQGRRDEAKKLIRKVAAINKRELPEHMLDKVNEEKKVEMKHLPFAFVLRFHKHELTSSCSLMLRFSLNLGYMCLILNVGKFGLNIFLVQFLFGITEVPAHLLCFWFLEFLGRKKSLQSTLLIGGVVCLLTLAFTPGKNR